MFCTCVRSDHEVYACLCVVHKINYIIYSLAVVFWNLTKAYNFKGEAGLLFCVQRG